MAVKFPEYVQIGGHRYKVLYPYRFRERKEDFGQHDGSLLELRISNVDGGGANLPDSQDVDTFFHEVLHAIDQVFLSRKVSNGPDGENIISALGAGLTQVFMAGQFPVLEVDDAVL